ncbi:MAG: alpha/beta fold hydrolase [Candidatus Woesearchaeota archaeon]
MRRVFIIHGWGGHPNEKWRPWLKSELEKRGFQVIMPQMPDTDIPRIDAWVKHLKDIVGKPDKDTYFVGHSIGCPAILRYLQTISTPIGGALFIAGFWQSIHEEKLKNDEELAIFKPWLTTPINSEKIRKVLKKSIALFSDNDPWIPLSEAEAYRKEIGAEIVIEHNKGHFGEKTLTKLPEALKAIEKLTR